MMVLTACCSFSAVVENDVSERAIMDALSFCFQPLKRRAAANLLRALSRHQLDAPAGEHLCQRSQSRHESQGEQLTSCRLIVGVRPLHAHS